MKRQRHWQVCLWNACLGRHGISRHVELVVLGFDVVDTVVVLKSHLHFVKLKYSPSKHWLGTHGVGVEDCCGTIGCGGYGEIHWSHGYIWNGNWALVSPCWKKCWYERLWIRIHLPQNRSAQAMRNKDLYSFLNGSNNRMLLTLYRSTRLLFLVQYRWGHCSGFLIYLICLYFRMLLGRSHWSSLGQILASCPQCGK